MEKIKFLSEKDNANLIRFMKTLPPPDVIRLTEASDLKLYTLWNAEIKNAEERGLDIPSDLFFANTIPLLDCRVEIDERDHSKNIGHIIKFRVCIFPNYADEIDRLAEMPDVAHNIGFVCAEHESSKQNFSTMHPIYVTKYSEGISTDCDVLGYIGMKELQRSSFANNTPKDIILAFVSNLLSTWYGIQIALLHPQVREVFRNPRTVIDKPAPQSGKNRKKRPVRYVKEHVLNADDLDRIIYGDGEDGEKRRINRRALVWYVIGHWRTQKNGKKVFVQPYWKGALRELKQALPEREREIAQAI